MRAYFSRRYKFSASHRLHSMAYSDEKNWKMFGKCNNPHGHGHNYVLEVTAGGQVDAQTGMVCDMVKLDAAVHQNVVGKFDLANLNMDESFRELVPTTENLCTVIHAKLLPVFNSGELGRVELVRVRVEETQNNFFEYAGD